MGIKIQKIVQGTLDYIEGLANSNGFIKSVFLVIVWVVALIPVWLTIGIWSLVDPSSAFEKLMTLACCFFFMGGLQIFFGIFGVACTAAILED